MGIEAERVSIMTEEVQKQTTLPVSPQKLG